MQTGTLRLRSGQAVSAGSLVEDLDAPIGRNLRRLRGPFDAFASLSCSRQAKS